MATRRAADGGTEPPRPGEDTVTTDDTYRAAGADPSDDGQTGSDSASDESDKRPRNRGAERRIRRLTSQRAQAEKALEDAEKENDELRRQLQELQAKAPKPKKPKLADFDDEDAYAEALFAWKAAEKETPKLPEKKKRAPTRGPTQQELADFLKAGKDEFGEDFATAQDLASKNRFALSKDMVEYLLESDRGHEMFMELSRQTESAGRIAQLSAVQVGIEMAKLEQTLGAAGARSERDKGGDGQASEEQPREANGQFKRRGAGSNAPPPGPKREGGGTPGGAQNVFTAQTSGGEDARHGDLDDWMAQRMAAERARRRRGL